jgi:hypothetical protein
MQPGEDAEMDLRGAVGFGLSLSLLAGGPAAWAAGGKSGGSKIVGSASSGNLAVKIKGIPSLSPVMAFLYGRLSSLDKQAFSTLAEAIGRTSPSPEKLELGVADLGRLAQLAVYGRFVSLSVDSQGSIVMGESVARARQGSLSGESGSLLSQLADRVAQPLGGGVVPGNGNSGPTPADLGLAITHTIAQYETISQGPGTATCVSAALERMLAQTRPAEYARLAAGLAWDGQVTLQNGLRVSIANSARTGPGGGKRDVVSKVFQESMLEFARSTPPEIWSRDLSAYRLRHPGSGGANLSGGSGGGSGGSTYSAAGGSEEYSGGRYAPVATYGGGRFVGVCLYGDGTLEPQEASGGSEAGGAAFDGARAPGGLTIGQARWLYIQVLGDTPETLAVTSANRENVYNRLVYVLSRRSPLPVIAGVVGTGANGAPTHHIVTLASYAPTAFEVADPGQDAEDNQVPVEGASVKRALEFVFDF